MSTISRRIATLLFLDVKGYSQLSENQLRRFFQHVLPRMASTMQEAGASYTNTWGDAIVSVADDPLALAMAALNLRDLFLNQDWVGMEMPHLLARIALHAGAIYVGDDPFSGHQGIVGTQINVAARIEPITSPGHVWATDTFISLISQQSQSAVGWDELGEIPLAKAWGAKHLFRVRRSHESASISPSLIPLMRDDGAPSIELDRTHPDILAVHVKRPDAAGWLTKAIETSIGHIQLDAIGVKLDSVYRMFKANEYRTNLPAGRSCTARLMIQKAGSIGAVQRARLERDDKVTADAEQYNRLWPSLAGKIRREGITDIRIRAFEFMPFIYLIRVNDKVLAGTYLAGTGLDGFTLDLIRKDGAVFNQYAAYFELLWADANQSGLDAVSS